MPRITISYRRDDSGVITGRIFDRLAAHYGREAVFRDIDDIPPGVDFRRHISDILDDSDIVLAIVGPRWVGPRAGQSRLANAADPVRVEIEIALRKDRPLIPVLVLRGAMPRVEQLPESLQDFAYRHAVSIDAGQDFDVHMARLIRAMDRSLESMAERAAGGEPEGVAAAPTEPDLDALAEPSPSAAAELEALREANRGLEERLAALTAAPEALQPREDLARGEAAEAEPTRTTGSAIEAVRGSIRDAAPDPGLAQRRGRGAVFVLLGVLLGIAATFGVNEYFKMNFQTSSDAAHDLAAARQAADSARQDLASFRRQAEEDRTKLTAELAAAQQKTVAAQKQSGDRASALRDAQARADKAEKDIAAQKDIAANTVAQLAPLNAQVKSLSDQLNAQKNANSAALAQIDQLKDQIKGLRDQPTAAPASAAAPVTVTAAAEGEANWTVDERRKIQLALRALGPLQGDADGNFGPGTRTAIKQFQSFEGMPESGVLSDADRKSVLDMAQRLSQLLDRPATSPEGVAATSVKGAAQRYARAVGTETGKGARKDPAEAAYWYGLAAADGSAPAFTNLGTLVARGYGDTKPDPAGAAVLWRAAAARGEPTAMFNLGALWERGIGVSADPGRARAWYERAASHNDAAARAALKRLGG